MLFALFCEGCSKFWMDSVHHLLVFTMQAFTSHTSFTGTSLKVIIMLNCFHIMPILKGHLHDILSKHIWHHSHKIFFFSLLQFAQSDKHERWVSKYSWSKPYWKQMQSIMILHIPTRSKQLRYQLTIRKEKMPALSCRDRWNREQNLANYKRKENMPALSF